MDRLQSQEVLSILCKLSGEKKLQGILSKGQDPVLFLAADFSNISHDAFIGACAVKDQSALWRKASMSYYFRRWISGAEPRRPAERDRWRFFVEEFPKIASFRCKARKQFSEFVKSKKTQMIGSVRLGYSKPFLRDAQYRVSSPYGRLVWSEKDFPATFGELLAAITAAEKK